MLNMNTSTSFKNQELEENPGTTLNLINDSATEKKDSNDGYDRMNCSSDGNDRMKLRRLIKEKKLEQQLNEEEHLKFFSQDITNMVKSQINNYYILQLTIDAR